MLARSAELISGTRAGDRSIMIGRHGIGLAFAARHGPGRRVLDTVQEWAHPVDLTQGGAFWQWVCRIHPCSAVE
jgi:hypothetical protein